MNLYLVPKYTKYNDSLKQIYFASVRPEKYRLGHTLSTIYIEEPKSKPPVPIIISHRSLKEHPQKHVKIVDALRKWSSSLKQQILKEEPQKKKSSLAKWVDKQKSKHEIKSMETMEKKRLKEWDKWKKEEQKRIVEAQVEKARHERELEFVEQLRLQQKSRANLAKQSLKTLYPYYVQRTLPPKDVGWTYEDVLNASNEEDTRAEPATKPRKETKPPKPPKEPKPPKKPKPPKPPKPPKEPKPQKPPKPPKEPKPPKPPKEPKPPKPTKIKKVKETIIHEDEEKYVTPKHKVKAEKAALFKPIVESRYVAAKRKKDRPLSKKFVNCFYRFCCEFYCWLSVAVIIGVTAIMLF